MARISSAVKIWRVVRSLRAGTIFSRMAWTCSAILDELVLVVRAGSYLVF